MQALKKMLPLFVFALSAIAFTNCHAAGPEMDPFDITALSITQQSSQFSTQGENGNQIATIGILKNGGTSRAEKIVIEVQYFDEQKKLIDVTTQQLYKVVAEAGKDTAFRVSREADRPKADYAQSSVRVVSAQQSRNRQGKTMSLLGDVFISWSPMLLLIFVYVFYMRKVSGRSSPSQRTADAMDKQIALQSRHLEVAERLAVALEKIASTK